MASSLNRSSNPILLYYISIIFKFSCSLALELFFKGNSLPVLKLLVSFLSNLEKVMKRDRTAYLYFLDNKVLQLVNLIIKSKAVEATFFIVPNRALIS